MNVQEAREILQTCSQKLKGIRDNLDIKIPVSMVPITTSFFFDQLECAMENIECRDYDLERLTKSESETTDLELMISEAYGKYLENKRASEHAEAVRVQKEIEKRREEFTVRLRKVFPENICNALNIEIVCDVNLEARAQIDYRSKTFVITYGPFHGGEWMIRLEDNLDTVDSEKLLDCLLVRLGQLRERASNVNGSR